MAIPSHLPTTKGTTRQGTIEECTVVVKISTMQAFTIHFRRPETKPSNTGVTKGYYDGSYGFDWLRDEYIYDIEQVYELGLDPVTGIAKANRLYRGDVAKLRNEYTRLSATDKDITEIASIRTMLGEPYLRAWLAIFPVDHNSGKNSNGVDLYLQVEQNQVLGKAICPLRDPASIAISFDTSNASGITVTARGISTLADLIAGSESEIDLLSSDPAIQSRSVKRYKNISKTVNIKATTGSNEVRVVRIIAKDKKFTRTVGLLCIYPNAEIKKADIKVVHCLTHRLPSNNLNTIKAVTTPQVLTLPDGRTATTQTTTLTKPSKWATSAPNEADILEELQYKSFNQALIDTTISTDYIALQNETDRRIKKFLTDAKYQQNVLPNNHSSLMKNLADIYYQEILNKKDKSGRPADIEAADNKSTYLFLTEYNVKYLSQLGNIGGAGWPAYTPCSGHRCKSIFKGGNFAIVYETGSPRMDKLVHELGHSFSLPHTFIKPKESAFGDVHYFYMGYTDNIMDYSAKVPAPATSIPSFNTPPSLINPNTMNATFKWQWAILRNDNTVTS